MNFTLASTDSDCNKAAYDGYLSMTHNPLPPSNSLIKLLKEDKEIESAVFALYFNNVTRTDGYAFPESSLEIGGYNLTMYSSNPSQVFFVPSSPNTVLWELEFTQASIGDWISTGNVTLQIQNSLEYIVGDLNALLELIPYLLFEGFECTSHPNVFTISCITEKAELLPELTFMYFNNTIILPAQKIWNCENNNCTLQIEFTEDQGIWKLGQRALLEYYTIYNYDNSSVGFAPAVPTVFHRDSSNSFIGFFSFLVLALV